MSAVQFDYYALQNAIQAANNMKGHWGCYESYRLDLKGSLFSTLDEWRLAGEEPKGKTYVANARANITEKRAALDLRKQEWSQLANNLSDFEAYLKQQDRDVADNFKQTYSAYTDYQGFWGKAKWCVDILYEYYAVKKANENDLTRAIVSWGKARADDLRHVLDDTKDWFVHGEGRYVANIISSVALTTSAVIGVVIGAVTFTFGSPAVIVVGAIGLVASAVGAAIGVYNTSFTVKNNLKALEAEQDDDPGRARFLGNTSSYSDYVSKTKFGSPEEYRKNAQAARTLDVIDGICTVVSLGTSAALTFGTTTTGVDKAGRELKSFSTKDIKSNVLKTFGIKCSKQATNVPPIRRQKLIHVNSADDIGNSTIQIINYSDEITENATTLQKSVKKIGNIEYKSRSVTIEKLSRSSEYASVVASNGAETWGFAKYAVQADRTKQTIDYTNAFMSKDKVSNISYLTKLKNVSSNAELQKLKTEHILKVAEKGVKAVGNMFETATSLEGKTAKEQIIEFAKKNTAVNAVDKYIYALPTEEGASAKDYVRGIGGSSGGEVWTLWDTLQADTP